MTSLRRDIGLLYAFQFFTGLVFFLPVAALYFTDIAGSERAAMYVFAVMNVTAALFDIPAGAIADRFGRKWCLIFSAIFNFAALALYAAAHSLPLLLLGGVLWGGANALMSGIAMAMLYDVLHAANRSHDFKHVNARIQTAVPLAFALSSLVGGFLADIDLRWTVIASLVPAFCVLPVTLLLREPPVSRSHGTTLLGHSRKTALYIIRHPSLLCLFAIGIFGWSIGQAVFNLSSLFYEDIGLSNGVIGLVNALTFVISMAGFLAATPLSRIIGDRPTLLLSVVLHTVLWIAATFFTGNFIMLPLAAAGLAFAIRIPIEHHLTNVFVDSHMRGTLLSMKSLVDRLSIALAALIASELIERVSPAMTIRILSAAMAINLLFVLALRIPRNAGEKTID